MDRFCSPSISMLIRPKRFEKKLFRGRPHQLDLIILLHTRKDQYLLTYGHLSKFDSSKNGLLTIIKAYQC